MKTFGNPALWPGILSAILECVFLCSGAVSARDAKTNWLSFLRKCCTLTSLTVIALQGYLFNHIIIFENWMSGDQRIYFVKFIVLLAGPHNLAVEIYQCL